MGYRKIHYNKQGEPYIVEKNFGYEPQKSEDNSSHWTWYITNRGVKYLTTAPFGKRQEMPGFVNDDQLADLKAYNMLRRSDGTVVGSNRLYPSDTPGWLENEPTVSPKSQEGRVQPSKRPIKAPPPPALKPQEKGQRGLWAWLKSLFG
jgi:hypothetical protein